MKKLFCTVVTLTFMITVAAYQGIIKEYGAENTGVFETPIGVAGPLLYPDHQQPIYSSFREVVGTC